MIVVDVGEMDEEDEEGESSGEGGINEKSQWIR